LFRQKKVKDLKTGTTGQNKEKKTSFEIEE